MKQQNENLPCELMSHELREKSLEHAAKLNAIDKLEGELAYIKKEFKDRIEREELDERDLRVVVETGIERRDVAIEFRPNFADDTMETYRLDTMAFVRARPLEKEEVKSCCSATATRERRRLHDPQTTPARVLRKQKRSPQGPPQLA